VILPVAGAHPAKFVFALLAGHVVAAPVLLYRGLALWALLGVCCDPICRLRVISTLLNPQFNQRADGWQVALLSAAGVIKNGENMSRRKKKEEKRKMKVTAARMNGSLPPQSA